MVGEHRRYAGTVTAPANSITVVTIYASSGETVIIKAFALEQSGAYTGSWVALKPTGYGARYALASDTAPVIRVYNTTLPLSSSFGLDAVDYPVGNSVTFHYAFDGVKIN
jgi:hypothetical protein